MAHKGNRYPVHFRRDYNLDIHTNNTGYGAGYALVFPQMFGSLGGSIDGIEFLCIAYDERTFQGLRWRSDEYGLSGRHLRVEMETSVAKGFPDVEVTGELLDRTLGSLFKFQATRNPGSSYFQFTGGFDFGSVTNPGMLDPLFNTGWSARAIQWAEWNNL